ncbi:MAG: helix-turn-helix domain-containing protein [Trueperaceae bacterium]
MPRVAVSQDSAPRKVVAVARRLGSNIRTARLRRQIRQEDLAKQAGITAPTLRKVEEGYLGTGLGAYIATLWALGLEEEVARIADPAHDLEGQTLEAAARGERVRPSDSLSNDF